MSFERFFKINYLPMKLPLNFLLLIFVITVCQFSFGEKKVEVTVQLPSEIDYKKMSVSYNNGLAYRWINPEIKDNSFTISDSCYSRYATITINYPDSTEVNGIPGFCFWVSDKPAIIRFYRDSVKKNNPFSHFYLTNALSVDNQGKQLDNYTSKESQDSKAYYLTHLDSLDHSTNEAYEDTLSTKLQKLAHKELRYIKDNPIGYFSLWIFNEEIAGSRTLPARELLQFYNTTFPDSLKQTFEGKEIIKKLSGRINTKRGGEAPDFIAKDIDGKIIALNKLHGRYVLLDFWASWCVPCMREMPEIKSIREKYSPKKLEIISITLEYDYNSFKAALEKIKPSWIEIYNNRDLINKYVIAPIPQLYLIDRDGYVIYNKEEEKDYDLTKLKQLLNQVMRK